MGGKTTHQLRRLHRDRLLVEKVPGADKVDQALVVLRAEVMEEQLVEALVDRSQVSLGLGPVGVLGKHLVDQRRGGVDRFALEERRELLLDSVHGLGEAHHGLVEVGVDLFFCFFVNVFFSRSRLSFFFSLSPASLSQLSP